jgi:hypothetical protein
MSSDDLPAAARRGRWRRAVLVVAGLACLAIAVAAGTAAHAALVRGPTAGQRAAAAVAAVAGRWHTWPAGRILPATLAYDTSLLTTETASRAGIAPGAGCAAALDPGAARQAGRDRCQAGLRATYTDQLEGTVYTVGVLAFPDARLAAAFAAGLPRGGIVLRAFALPGTASARFSAAARQAGTAEQTGPFVVLTVAGYADGEPAGAGQQARPSAFSPAGQLAAAVSGSLAQPVTVDCASREWSC